MPNVAEVTLDCFRCHGSLFEENARRLLQEVSGPGSRISYPMPKMKKEKKTHDFAISELILAIKLAVAKN